MAVMIPESIQSMATTGERILFQTLKNHLDDDYIVYYEPKIKEFRADFVIIGPYLGLLVLEVKDYTVNSLHSLNHDQWLIHTTSDGLQTVKSPLKQAMDYMFTIQNVLKKDTNLINHDGKYKFKLKFPCGYGTVFTRLSQEQCITHNLYDVIDPMFLLTREEIDSEKDRFSEENLIEKLLSMFKVPFRLKEPLTHNEINAIRYHLFPEVRVSGHYQQTTPYRDQLLLSLHDLQTMDLHQEKLAKQIGDKNRLIRGVAGSGKTLILASRVRIMKQEHPDWRVLVLSYNISLSRSIYSMIRAKMEMPVDLDAAEEHRDSMKGITVRNFHEWLKKDLRISEQSIPDYLEKLEKGEAILPTYDAVLIDEGQDFEPEWFRLVSFLLNPETYSMLLVEDRAQTIYPRKRSYRQDTGLDFRGRSKVLQINYRNTAEIITFAWNFFQKHSGAEGVTTGEIEGQEIIPPRSTRRKGPEPAIVQASDWKEEIQTVVQTMKKLHQHHHVPFEEMVILYRANSYNRIVSSIAFELNEADIPFQWITENAESKRSYEKEDGKAKISTIDSSKGLDFQAVFIVNIDNMPFALEEDKTREAALLYIGMTRAIEYLMISYSDESEYTKYFDEVVEQRQRIQSQSKL
ncbi:nuclease [Salibacterium salarium]|uniref:Nuclease n=1 Tax=Salibacterium salarium TaxID=284579 RepID=A0A3R9P404_9BACI|nr:3'-5' exonuclease [Salibacterium salarium]RSL30543.1 nuclease [Salibacterium salarium]